MGGKIRKRLKRLAENRSLARIRRRIPGTHSQRGFVLGVGAGLVLLAVEDEFVVDGFVVLRFRDIDRVRRSRKDKLHERWLRAEGLDLEGLPLPPLDLADMPSLLRSLGRSGLVMILEAEHPDHDWFELGRLERVGRKSAGIRYLDVWGEWMDVVRKIRHRHITLVRFLDRYSSIYARHAPPLPG